MLASNLEIPLPLSLSSRIKSVHHQTQPRILKSTYLKAFRRLFQCVGGFISYPRQVRFAMQNLLNVYLSNRTLTFVILVRKKKNM